MISISAGHSAGYLTGQVASGRENYYTGAVATGEPPGVWWGRGAESLGLTGLVDAQDMTALYEHHLDPRDDRFRQPAEWGRAPTLGGPLRRYASADDLYDRMLAAEPEASGERREELRLNAERSARRNVRFLDVTFSVPKSVTVLAVAFERQAVDAERAGEPAAAAAWLAHRDAVEAAVLAGNRAMLDYLQDVAGYSRVGHHGGVAGRFVDAHDWIVASFLQHDSRDHDPQLHVHNAILNRVQCPDGKWRTLATRALYAQRAAAGVLAERVMEEHLSRALGVRFATRPDGKAREVVGVAPAVMDLFSSRRRAITAKLAGWVEEFRAHHGRDPNTLELDRLQRRATLATRRAKSATGETTAARLDRWDAELRAEVAGGLAGVAHDVLGLVDGQPPPVGMVTDGRHRDRAGRGAGDEGGVDGGGPLCRGRADAARRPRRARRPRGPAPPRRAHSRGARAAGRAAGGRRGGRRPAGRPRAAAGERRQRVHRPGGHPLRAARPARHRARAAARGRRTRRAGGRASPHPAGHPADASEPQPGAGRRRHPRVRRDESTSSSARPGPGSRPSSARSLGCGPIPTTWASSGDLPPAPG